MGQVSALRRCPCTAEGMTLGLLQTSGQAWSVVYSFGVMVKKIITGRKNIGTSQSEESIQLITSLEEKVKSDKLQI